MTWRKRTIMEMAQEAGMSIHSNWAEQKLESFAALVRKEALTSTQCEELPEQEPVAWRYDLKQKGSFAGTSREYSRIKLSIGENWMPLYTTPPNVATPLAAQSEYRAVKTYHDNKPWYVAQPEPIRDSTCNEILRAQGKAYPRTCMKCGLGPCFGEPKQPLAAAQPEQEPAAEIVSDAFGCLSTQWADEWIPNEGDKLYTTSPQRTWVGLTNEEKMEIWATNETSMVISATEAKLKAKNETIKD